MKKILVKRAKGQALVVFLGFAAAMIGMLLVSFNSGQVTNAKMRAMNAADAAAYSGAVWEARTLNFQAYMNRAMIVNEVTIAQSVSLRSWIDYMANFVNHINMIARFIPYLGTATTAISQALNRVDDTMQSTMPTFEAAARTLALAEHKAQKAFNTPGAAAAWDIASDIASKNGAEISLGGKALMGLNLKSWDNFTETYTSTSKPDKTSGDGRKRLRAVALDSRDGFSQNRPWDLNFLFVAKIQKQGGTDLVNFDAWKGLDSAQLCWWRAFRSCRGVPLGWGGAQAYSTKAAVQGIGTHGEGSDWNRGDGFSARSAANTTKQARSVGGAFPNYRDLKDLDTANTAKQKLSFAVEVIIADSKVPTADSAFGAKVAMVDGTVLALDPQYTDTKGVYGLAEACVAFERPVGESRKDGGIERPSLFNPYWRASLATPSPATRLVAGGAKKLAAFETIFAGAGTCG
ncbi:pilus assembly protein TadG-related protein [Massilia sp. S19_KUP03_FR1]|uniref:pilus assembly protein TadG-related protein n=1 Tax=Massilia sp. S19_KUP03_FR1 TaxID=3025503 RepID=UPI002FCD5309